MKLPSLLQSALLLPIVLALSACGSEPENQQELLLGRWELAQATRNGNPTESLSELYFVFNEDGSMNTNLPVPGMAAQNQYKLDGRTLYQYNEESPDELSYYIEEFGDSTLVLSTEIRNVRFSFTLRKQTASEQEQ